VGVVVPFRVALCVCVGGAEDGALVRGRRSQVEVEDLSEDDVVSERRLAEGVSCYREQEAKGERKLVHSKANRGGRC